MIASPPDSLRLVTLFITEARELLQRADDALLQLEHTPDTPPTIAATFRAVHSLKGMSATVGLTDIAAALHQAESLLARARDAGTLASAHGALLLDVTRAVRDAIEPLPTEPARPLSADLLERVQRTAASVSVSPVLRPTATPLGQSAPDSTCWRVDLAIAPEAELPAARATVIVKRLATLAPVLRVAPDAESMQSEQWDRQCTVWLGGDVDAERLRSTVLRVGAGADCVITRDARVSDTSANQQGARTVRVPAERLDELLDRVGELVLARNRVQRAMGDDAAPALRAAWDETAALIAHLRDAILHSRMLPLSQVFDRFPRFVRDTAQALGKDVELVFAGREIEVDRSLIDELAEPLLHLLRNAVDHGLEPPDERLAAGKSAVGRLAVRAVRDGAMLDVSVDDDGRGVDRASVAAKAAAAGMPDAAERAATDAGLLQLLAMPGLTTAANVTPLSGRGVGVDVVVAQAQALGGRVSLSTQARRGTCITLRVPLSVAIIRALILRVADERYAIPLVHVLSTHRRDALPAVQIADAGTITLGAETMPLLTLRQRLGLPTLNDVSGHIVVLDGVPGRRALLVDACLAQQEIVVKPLPRVRGAATLFTGGTVLADGAPSLILDIHALH
jgi:two-component system, chemotaxis family, sensor kinase CheA